MRFREACTRARTRSRRRQGVERGGEGRAGGIAPGEIRETRVRHGGGADVLTGLNAIKRPAEPVEPATATATTATQRDCRFSIPSSRPPSLFLSLLTSPSFLYARARVSAPLSRFRFFLARDCVAKFALLISMKTSRSSLASDSPSRFLLFFLENRQTPTASHAHPLLLTFTGIRSRQRGHLASSSVASRYLYRGIFGLASNSCRKESNPSTRRVSAAISPDGLSPATVP